MTVAHAPAARQHARAQPDLMPRPINWAALGVIVAVGMHLVAGVWFAATLSARVNAIEQQLPPGSIQRLQERTDQIQATLLRLEAKP